MSIQIYNTLTKQKEPFQTLEPGVVKMYVCGPTVYSDAHVGHAMSGVTMDIIRRYLEYRGYDVQYVMNYTDVDDKIINRANLLGQNPVELAAGYINEYDRHLHDLNIKPATAYPKVSEMIPEIVEFVEGLVDGGHSYPIDGGSVYFRVQKKADYGKLSNRKLADMAPETGLDTEDKEHPADFALWKAEKEGEIAWESPWGRGRPGWHIECSTMARALLGDQIDIHGGGNDLIFPHHENEIAQSEALTGKRFATYWVHNGMLQLKGEKMSKSLGNLITIQDFLDEHDADVFRLIVLGGYYRSPLTFNDEVIGQAESGLERILIALRPADAGNNTEAVASLEQQSDATLTDFETAMDDDFNTAKALASLYELVRAINTAKDANAPADAIGAAQDRLRQLGGVLGLRLEEPELSADAAPFIDLLLDLRQTLRGEKNFALADKIRDDLTDLGVIVEDSAQGTTWRIG